MVLNNKMEFFTSTDLDQFLLTTSLFAYLIGWCILIWSSLESDRKSYLGFTVFVLALTLHTISIALSWFSNGHGPFLNLYEILNSNVWSLSFIFAIFYWVSVRVRLACLTIFILIAILIFWLLFTDSKMSHFPPSYNTIWLYFHVIFGKIFFGLLVIASGLALASLNTGSGLTEEFRSGYIELAYPIVTFSFVFQSLMLVVGAIWAQDAWGRYWAWDPLESWAFLTWLCLLFYLHVRAHLKHRLFLQSALIVLVYVMAFLTFFGVPFISLAPHKGVI